MKEQQEKFINALESLSTALKQISKHSHPAAGSVRLAISEATDNLDGLVSDAKEMMALEASKEEKHEMEDLGEGNTNGKKHNTKK